ncbi:hypothetical protein EMIHUDRAFT_106641 [Emiliania huxleyi CCMP1516]|uniref:Peptidase S8/S53 domain-containing protein n=2 Tax=Emiliania huxleyi TaxID=2903 RepID=A0A0D3I6S9_EMIH1|nr:hypothetical protein EMIHUDRAFT_106641 [Emiliania huxleyi CCMP1516]EOD06964.1 hypothetical protein EMIHUDRAFT_106641 [Emiliania huxleyi CCMP1516]|eukprot:XP_005759393.1 hypothetical protein EMIHUDRAFT_106641 [Emiliania huxleyi CCMP1516]
MVPRVQEATPGWIVGFDAFDAHEALCSLVASALSPLPRGSWRLVARPPHWPRLPTDFVAIEVTAAADVGSTSRAARRLLTQQAGRIAGSRTRVRGVWPRRWYTAERPSPSPAGGGGPRRRPLGSSASQTQPTSRDVTGRGKQTPYNFITKAYNASRWWSRDATGKGLKVAVFDTGLNPRQNYLRDVVEAVDFTPERNTADVGDLVGEVKTQWRGLDDAAGAARRGVDCAGFAPDASLYVLRVFTSKQASATDWFLEAFNHALHRRVHLINLAVGGPDYRDTPFVDKVSQLAAAGITIVSGAGNSGPGWGSLMNPADDAAVLGVAGLDKDGKLAAWSSRGMTLWEEPLGAGRAGVDVITHGEFWGADQHNACQHQWGTSVACPVVVGLLALLLSSLPERQRNTLLNPAALKQVVYAGSSPLPDYGWLEQGAGLLDAPATEAAARAFEPHASAVPSVLDLRPTVGCPYLWPLCDMPLYATMQPLFVNLTLLNSRSATAAFAAPPLWRPRAGGHALHVSFAYDDHRGLSAHRGFLGVRLSVSSSASGWAGEVEGELVITLVDTALAANGSAAAARPAGSPHSVVVPLRATVVPTPPRRKRLLFDTLHSSAYPNGFFPNDDLSQLSVELMDWNGDSPHTNYVPLYASLRASGFYVESLRADLTSFDANLYGALLLLDPEEPFLPSEPAKLRADVTSRGLGLVVAADWHAPDLMASLDYTDEATKQRRVCGAGGANVPALNELLEPLGIGFGSQVYSGTYRLGGGAVAHLSGSSLRRFPAGGRLVSATLSRGVKRGDRWLGGEKGGREERALLARRARLSDASMTRPRHHLYAARGADWAPPLLARVPRLRAPYLDEALPAWGRAPFTPALTEAQQGAFVSQSRLLGILRGCTVDNASCRTPLVPRPTWRLARPPSDPLGGEDLPTAGGAGRFRGYTVTLALSLLGLGAIFAMVPRNRRRRRLARAAAAAAALEEPADDVHSSGMTRPSLVAVRVAQTVADVGGLWQ